MFKPALYVKANDKQRHDAKNICEEFSDELGEMSGRCLDIGSGPCDIVADFVLPRLNPEASIVCSDILECNLNFGKERYQYNRRMSFIRLDIEFPDLPENLIEQFDHVTSFYCLHWCHDKRQVFKNIFNLLKPGGTTLLVFVNTNPTRNAYQAMATMPLYQPYMMDIDHHIPVYYNSEGLHETFKALVKNVGFNVSHFSEREMSYVYKSSAVVRDGLLAINPFIERMPANLKERYAKDLVTEFERQCVVLPKNNNNQDDCNILARYKLFVTYLKKPLSK